MSPALKKKMANLYHKTHVLLSDGRMIDKDLYDLSREHSKIEGITFEKSLAVLILSLKEKSDGKC